MELRIWLAMGIASLGWGTSGVATRAALNAGIPPVGMVAIRSLLATILIYAVLAVMGRRLTPGRASLGLGAVMAITNLALPFILFTLAYQHASAGFVGLLVALIPLATTTLAHFLLPDEPMRIAKFTGLAVAFGGVAFLLASGDSGLAGEGRPLLAAGLAIAAVVSVSYAGVYAKGKSAGYDPIELTGLQFAGGSVLIVIAMFVMEGMPGSISVWGWTLLVYLTVVSSVTPFLAFYWVLRHTTSTKASLIGYVVPLIALVTGIVLIDEQLQFGIAAGGILILAGVILTDRAERRPARVLL